VVEHGIADLSAGASALAVGSPGFTKGDIVRDRDWGTVLFLIAFVIGVGATSTLVNHLQPPWSWRFPIAVASYVLLLIAIWLPLVIGGERVLVLASCVGIMLFGVLVVLAVHDSAHLWFYLVGGLLFFVQGLVATSTYWNRLLRNLPERDGQAYADTDE